MLSSFWCALFISQWLLSASSAQVSAPTRNYDVTSPVTNGPYVVDQILPCTYRLFSDVDSSSLDLRIVLKPTHPSATTSSSSTAASGGAAAAMAPASVATPTAGAHSSTATTNATVNTVIVIAENADVSKTAASAKREGNSTYYEHSINFKIPQTVIPGAYHVVFTDRSTNTDLAIPIEVRSAAAAVPSSSASANKSSSDGALSGSNNAHGSIFQSKAAINRDDLLYDVVAALLAGLLLIKL
ncbi:hypothetical protein BCR43DRAFT_527723 [Syncephalastrum racemosum]|uniref:Ser-Thr-rich glycosyl-phosphatidyl-inositol-anchored membrane family-domain-containing protein n=1 Tax=Syncephalastrum racemosum TaxID=13706 RepID=A0A1X2H255_SYNRA|nr:hypothetical protein BCR43DRAFT_527723 [Syncephalastrum racemosum]